MFKSFNLERKREKIYPLLYLKDFYEENTRERETKLIKSFFPNQKEKKLHNKYLKYNIVLTILLLKCITNL